MGNDLWNIIDYLLQINKLISSDKETTYMVIDWSLDKKKYFRQVRQKAKFSCQKVWEPWLKWYLSFLR